MNDESSSSRLGGLDLARFLAFVGMVIVNFKIVMGTGDDGSLLSQFMGALEGKAAATFVILAGIGLGLAAKKSAYQQTIVITTKRALFLLVIGLLNSLIFDADILHYYAFYFLFGALLIPLRSFWLAISILFVNLIFVFLVFNLDYDTGWNWETFTYSDFWTPVGFVRNLLFNGWHPVIPWIGFLLFGIMISRFSLSNTITQYKLILLGIITYVLAEFISHLIIGPLSEIDSALVHLATTRPIPPAPLYMLAGIGSACAVIGLCLRCSSFLDQIGILKILTPAGKQTLTLYIAHIFIGMGILEYMGKLEGQAPSEVVVSSLLFCTASVCYAFIWSKYFKRGPIESMMRKIAG